jgi:prepilin-type N-terminal cleavage/methylation domain-containing protein
MNKLRKNSKKGFTLVEIIVVLVIIAILIAALAPVMIGWINEARETTVRTEGRVILLALQTTATEHRALQPAAPSRATYLTAGANATVNKFAALMADADIRDNTNTLIDSIPAFAVAAALPGDPGRVRGDIGEIYVDAAGNIVGFAYSNPVRARDTDGAGPGWLLIGRFGTAANTRPTVAATNTTGGIWPATWA